MKHYNFFLLLFFCIEAFSQESFIIEYNISDEFSLMKSSKGKLYVSDSKSLFVNQTKIYDTNTLKLNEAGTEIIGDTIDKEYEVLKDFDTKYIYSESIIKYQKGVTQKDFLNIFNWEYLNQEKKILGYQCKAAKTKYRGREYIAFYTDEIKIKDGPWKFNGLDGLILEVFEINGRISFNATNVNLLNEKIPIKPNLDTENSLYLSSIISKAKRKYFEKKRAVEKKFNGIATTDFSNYIEIYDLNNQENYLINYDVFAEIKYEKEEYKTLTSNFELISNYNESNYKYIDKIQNIQGVSEYGYISEVGVLYKNLVNQTFEQNKVLYDQKFIIADTIPNIDWEILPSFTEQILNFNTIKAVANYEGNYIEAWFAPDILIENGPGQYGGLPGLILKLTLQRTDSANTNTKEITYYVAKKANQIEPKSIVKPKGGKIVSAQEYDEIYEEIMKKIKEMYGQGVEVSD